MTDKFKYFAPDDPAKIPEGYKPGFDVKTTLEMIRERERWLEQSTQCPTCNGHGRIAKGE